MSIKTLDRRESIGLSLSSQPVEELDGMISDEDTSCGFGTCHPALLQKFNTPKSFLINNGMLGLLNAGTYAYFIGCISTLEKRFAFEGKVTGIIMIAEEISPICFGFLIGYFGGGTHRPRFMAIVMMVGFISSFVMASPYFLYGAIRDSSALEQYRNRTDFELCDYTEKDYLCNKYPTIAAASIFFVGTFMKGFAVTAFNTIGLPYMDDNVKKKNTAMYFATSMILQLLGPALGFLLSSLCLQFYEDPFYDPGYGTEDPRWIGAWWLGYVIIGILMLTFSFPMSLFPRRFPGVRAPKTVRQQEDSKSVLGILKGMGNAVKRLLKNPILIFYVLGGVLRVNGTLGYFILMPKYVEMQFKQSASKANLFSGPVSIGSMMLGIFLGGVVIRKFLPRPRVLTGGLFLAEFFGLLALLISMQITCPSTYTDKTTTISKSLLNIETECNRDCLCTTKEYTPICGPDGKTTYFSPCHAGCSNYNKTGEDKEIYTDCKCVHNEYGDIITGEATKSYCNFECQWLIVYVAIISIAKFCSSTTGVPSTLLLLRCVNPEDKSVTLGLLSGLYSILAFIPFPLVYGAISDSCCLVWEHSCGKTGNCWIYDVNKFRYMLHGISSIFIILGSVSDIMVWYLSPRLKNFYEDEDKQDGKDNLNLGETHPNNADDPKQSDKNERDCETDFTTKAELGQNVFSNAGLDENIVNDEIRNGSNRKEMEE